MAEAFIPKLGTVYMFANENKTEDWHADFGGTIIMPLDIVPGAAYFVNLTESTAKNGKPMRKLSIGKQAKGSSTESTRGSDEGVLDDDVPF